jgi:hypothetical protein
MLKMPEPQVAWRPHDAVIAPDELWLRCFALGTMHTPAELEAFLRGEGRPTRHEYNLIAVALNEYFVERGVTQFVPCIEDEALITTRSLESAGALVPRPSPTGTPNE